MTGCRSLVALLILGMFGCSPDASDSAKYKTVPLTGKVTLDGKPYGPGTIGFIPTVAGTTSASAAVRADGSFEATTYVTGDGVGPGKYEVKLGGATEEDLATTDPAKMMAQAAGGTIETVTLDVPATGLTDIEIKLKSSKPRTVNPNDGMVRPLGE